MRPEKWHAFAALRLALTGRGVFWIGSGRQLPGSGVRFVGALMILITSGSLISANG